MQFKIVQLQINQLHKKTDRIYFGDADEFVHAKLLERSLSFEKITDWRTERLHNKVEVCAREGVGYKCLGMGHCSVKIALSKRNSLWLFNFFGRSEYNLQIDTNNIGNRVNQFFRECDEIEIETPFRGTLYNSMPLGNEVNVRIKKTRN